MRFLDTQQTLCYLTLRRALPSIWTVHVVLNTCKAQVFVQRRRTFSSIVAHIQKAPYFNFPSIKLLGLSAACHSLARFGAAL
jgi:hypothetical protein